MPMCIHSYFVTDEFFIFQIYRNKEKKLREEEQNLKLDKELLLWIVRLFNADPGLTFYNASNNH